MIHSTPYIPSLAISARTRSTPFTARVEAFGVKGYSVYNHMLLPTVFESVEEDYRHLKTHVQVWDVACERQVEISGKDAGRLVQMMTPRNLEKMQNDQCYYVPLVDARGRMINDPIAIKHEGDRWWLSIADSDVLLFAKGLATGAGLDVDVFEPDVSPLGVQGPKAETLMERIFGPAVHDIRFFRHARLPFADTEFVVARSGWSKQGGFEIYVDNTAYGEPLWDALFAVGADLSVRPGCPNLIERIEGGLLSYGNDITIDHTPYESGLEKYCSKDALPKCIGGAALADEAENGPSRQIRGLIIHGEKISSPCRSAWPVFNTESGPAGQVSSAAWSPDIGANIAIAMIDRPNWDPGANVRVDTPEGQRQATVKSLPFL